jgi:hypothetical protein
MVVARIGLLGSSPDLQGQRAASRKLPLLGIMESMADVARGTLVRRSGRDCSAEVVGLSIHNPGSTCKLIGAQALIQSENANPVAIF